MIKQHLQHYKIHIHKNRFHTEHVSKIIISNLFRGCIPKQFENKIEIITSGPSVWENFIRNIPADRKLTDLGPTNTIITLCKNKVTAPILVLVELKYKGNIGSIIRSAVQSNLFESIILIGSNERDISNKHIKYYSIMNSPLIPIIKYNSIGGFLDNMDKSREIISINMHPDAVHVYEKDAKEILLQDHSYIIMGSEDNGIPEHIQEITNHHLVIPHMSSCINVSAAFSVVLTVMNLSRYENI